MPEIEEIQRKYVRSATQPFPFDPAVQALKGPSGPVIQVQISDLIPSDFCKDVYDPTAPEDLVESIDKNDVLKAIWISPGNKVLDGHRRIDACRKLGKSIIPAQIVEDVDLLSIEANRYRVKTNVEILAELKAIKGKFVEAAKARQLAGRALTPSQKKDQGRVLEHLGKHVGLSKGSVAGLFEIQEKEPELLPQIDEGKYSISSAVKKIHREERRQSHLERRIAEEIPSDIMPVIKHGSFQDLATDIADGSIGALITDPPYDRDWLPQWDDLGRIAKRVLRPGGFFAAYSGQMHLLEVLQILSKHLRYHWTGAMIHTPGGSARVHPVGAIVGWKPVLIFSNGQSDRFKHQSFNDVFHGTGKDKDLHEWQQDLDPFKELVRQFSDKGDRILDPLAGGGTTIEACMLLGREVTAFEIEADAYEILQKRFLKSPQNPTGGEQTMSDQIFTPLKPEIVSENESSCTSEIMRLIEGDNPNNGWVSDDKFYTLYPKYKMGEINTALKDLRGIKIERLKQAGRKRDGLGKVYYRLIPADKMEVKP